MSDSAAPGPGEPNASSGKLKPVPTQDLRKHLRFKLEDASTTMYVKGFLTSVGLGRANKARAAVNLSEGGMLVMTGEPLAVGTKVQVRVELQRHEDAIESAGEVRWCFQSARNAAEYYAGIRFTNLPELEVKKIAKMREWFTSPEYKTRTATRRRTSPPGEQTNA